MGIDLTFHQLGSPDDLQKPIAVPVKRFILDRDYDLWELLELLGRPIPDQLEVKTADDEDGKEIEPTHFDNYNEPLRYLSASELKQLTLPTTLNETNRHIFEEIAQLADETPIVLEWW